MRRARRGAALLLLSFLAVPMAQARASIFDPPSVPRLVMIFRVQGVSFGALLGVPEVEELGRAGGAALLNLTGSIPAGLARSAPAVPSGVIRTYTFRAQAATSLAVLASTVRTTVLDSGAARALVIVTSTVPSPSMVHSKDDLHPIVLAEGDPATLFPDAGSLGTLTSDSTRRTGVVVDADIGPTIAAFLGRSDAALPGGGHPIRAVDAPPPFELHERYLAMRRMTVPIQTAAGLYVTLGGLFCLGILALGRRAPMWLSLLAIGIAVSVGPLAAALLGAGHLPSLSYATVVPFVVLVTIVVSGLVVLGSGRGALHPFLPLGALLLAFLLAEAIVGWTAALTPFLGGSELDGGRFYGLPNVFIGLLLGASLYVAQRLDARAGFVLLLAAGLFAGLPFAGANLGGAITLFAAAGLWWPLRSRGRLGGRELAITAGVVVLGTAVVLVANRVSPSPTHITNFEEHAGGLVGIWRTLVDRLGVGVRLIAHNPFALVPVVGVLATLAVVLKPPTLFAESLRAHPAWRDALLVILLASVVAYVVNDSGPAACGLGFGMALGGLLAVSLIDRAAKMDVA